MSKLHGKNIEPASISVAALTAQAIAAVRSGKLLAVRSVVTAYSFPAASSSVVTTQVTAVALVATPQTGLAARGIYAGAVSGANDPLRVLLRNTGTDNGLDDGTGDDVYAVLSESSGVFTLSLKKADGSTHTLASLTPVDFYFVEIRDLDSLATDALLQDGIGGVVDATTSNIVTSVRGQLDAHENGSASKHDASEVDYERADSLKKNISAASDDVESAITNIDDAIGIVASLTPVNYVAATSNVVGNISGIDTAVGAAQSAANAAQADISGYTGVLKLLEHPTNKNRVIINPATINLPDGSVLIQELNLFRVLFPGAQVDFGTGQIRSFDGVTIVDTFTPPVITNGSFRWASLSLIPTTINAINQITVVVEVLISATENVDKNLVPRPGFLTGKPLGQISLTGAVAGLGDILSPDIERLSVGSGGGGSQVLREIPTGVIDGVNNTFVLTEEPLTKESTFIFLNHLYVRLSEFSLVTDTITFASGSTPQVGQQIEVFYFPDPLGIGGGRTDLTNISVNPQPITSGSNSLGSVTRGWSEVIIKDRNNADLYRLQVASGVFSAQLVV